MHFNPCSLWVDLSGLLHVSLLVKRNLLVPNAGAVFWLLLSLYNLCTRKDLRTFSDPDNTLTLHRIHQLLGLFPKK